MEIFTDKNLNLHAVNEFFENNLKIKNEIHCIKIIKDGKTALAFAPNPYSLDDKREVYSMSKGFAATAVGIACDMGIMSDEERIVDIFPDKCPEKISDNLSEMKVKHLLSMNTGTEGCVMGNMWSSDDCVKAFLASDFKYKPGTHFSYNTGATCMLSAIIEKKTGETIFDFASEHLFFPLGIKMSKWNSVADGTTEGGIGLHISCNDAAKIGELYLNNGVYNGKRILSEEWVKKASSPISDNSSNGSPDWCAGYGYQLWMNADGGYRADGAYGQLCIILPEKDIVAAVFGRTADMQSEVTYVLNLIDGMYENNPNDDGDIYFKSYPLIDKCEYKIMPFMNRWIHLKKNINNFTKMYITYEDSNLAVYFTDGERHQRLSAGNGRFVRSSFVAKWRKPKLIGIMQAAKYETVHFASCFGFDGDTLKILMRSTDNPAAETMSVFEENGKMKIVTTSIMLEPEEEDTFLVPEARELYEI